ncbi:MAG TPA: PA domain-containing protein [Candidatus Limnocylindria bacterium]
MPRPTTRRALALGAVLALTLSAPVGAIDPGDEGAVPIDSDAEHHRVHHQHGGEGGHLPASQSTTVELIGKARINQDQEGRVADVGVLGNYAYLAAWSAPRCQKGGVYVFDINDPTNPKQINFIRTANDSYSGEGIHAIHLSTSAWTGDLLAFNNEDCLNNAGKTSKHSIGGFTLVDVTNPKTHRFLVEGFGDRDTPTLENEADAHEIHSIFVWEDDNGTATDADDSAYAVVTDNEEAEDVDIFDITDPRNPTMLAEFDLNALFPQIVQPDLGAGSSFLHDMVVKKVGTDYVMLLSYWDGGYVTLNVNDPANPVYIGDSDFANPDPELLESTGTMLPPEGNGHQAEFSMDSNYIVATDEDFAPYAPFLSIDGGPSTPFSAGVATGPQLEEGDTLAGGTRFARTGCDPSMFPAPDGASIAVIERGACAFQVKLDNASAAGYEAGIIFNSADPAASPNCEGLVNMLATTDIVAFFVARSVGYSILGIPGYTPANCPGGANPALPAAGTAGEPIEITVAFDGWGYVHLFANGQGKLTELDTYAIPEAHDSDFASGFGDLSVHEVAMSQVRNDLAYFSYYAGGFRVAQIVNDELVEVGHFIDAGGDGGNNFWGVQVWQHEGEEYVLASDRDFGLYIFQYTGP